MLDPERIASNVAVKYWEHGDERSQAEVFADNGVLNPKEIRELALWARQLGLSFVVTPFDVSQVEALASIPHDAIKIASGDITNFELLEAVRDRLPASPVILSTGGARVEEMFAAMIQLDWGSSDVVLACSLQYPTPLSSANFGRVSALRALSYGSIPLAVGYSDHTLGIESGPLLVAVGAEIVEKHFTMNKSDDPHSNPDDHMALSVVELQDFVRVIKGTEAAMGSHALLPHPGEVSAVYGARRSLFLVKDVSAGETLTRQNVTSLRPGPNETADVPASAWHNVVGIGAAKRDLFNGDRLRFGDFV